MRLKHIAPPTFVIFSLLSLSSWVQGEVQSLSFQAKLGFVSPANNHIHSSLTAGLGIVLPMKDQVSVSFDLGFWTSSVDTEPHKFYEGRMTLFPVLASLRYSFLPDKTINPCVFIGTGYVFAHFKMEDIITIPEITVNQTIENGFCWLAGAGTIIRISESFGLSAEGIYLNRKTTGLTTITDLNFGENSEKFSVRLHAFIFQVGIEYFFH